MEKVILKIYDKNGKHITDDDVTEFSLNQIMEMIKVKEEYGLTCSIKRVIKEG